MALKIRGPIQHYIEYDNCFIRKIIWNKESNPPTYPSRMYFSVVNWLNNLSNPISLCINKLSYFLTVSAYKISVYYVNENYRKRKHFFLIDESLTRGVFDTN